MTTHQRTTRYVAGMDLHKRTLVMTIMDHDGTVVYQNGTHGASRQDTSRKIQPNGAWIGHNVSNQNGRMDCDKTKL